MFDDFGRTSTSREARQRFGGSFAIACALCGVMCVAALQATASVKENYQPAEDDRVQLPRSLHPPTVKRDQPVNPPAVPPREKAPTHVPRTPRVDVQPPPLERDDAPFGSDEGALGEAPSRDEGMVLGLPTPPAPPPVRPGPVVPPVDSGSNHYDRLKYPVVAERKGIEGAVVVGFDVSENGAVLHPRIVSGPKELHDAVLKAAATWRFQPARQGGKPVLFKGMVRRVVFRLQDA